MCYYGPCSFNKIHVEREIDRARPKQSRGKEIKDQIPISYLVFKYLPSITNSHLIAYLYILVQITGSLVGTDFDAARGAKEIIICRITF